MAGWLTRVFEPGQVVELRALGVQHRTERPHVEAGFFDFDHLDLLVENARQLTTRSTGVYITLNPLARGILSRRCCRVDYAETGQQANDDHITRRRWLYLDIDSIRIKDICSTAAEKAAALEVARSVYNDLLALGWPRPLRLDSGNGYALLYRVDLPNNDRSTLLIKQVLEALAQRYDTDQVKIDQQVFNASRICRIPGTCNRKGDNTHDRPHRTTGVIRLGKGDGRDAVPRRLLRQLAGLTAPPQEDSDGQADGDTTATSKEVVPATPRPAGTGVGGNGRAFTLKLNVERWLQAHGVGYTVKAGTASGGRTVYALDVCPFDAAHGKDAAIMQDVAGKLSAKCFHSGCSGRGWAEFQAKIGPPAAKHYDLLSDGKATPARAAGQAGADGQADAEGDQGDTLPLIFIDVDEHRVNDEAVAALVADARLYQRGNVLVRIVREKVAPGAIRRSKPPSISVLPVALLREWLTANALWVKPNRKGVPVPTHPPPWCVRAVYDRETWKDIPPLEGVFCFPLLKPNGTILTTAGYDHDTGLLLTAVPKLPTITERPTLEQAVAARDRLLDVVCDFPFEKPEHKAAWLAALLTPLARFAYEGPTPLFLVDGNRPAVGKGLLLQVISAITTGRPMATRSFTEDTTEMEKRITSIAISGKLVVLLDNVKARLGGDPLEAALTSTTWEGRILGVSKDYTGPLLATWYATANNTQVEEDIVRRTCPIRLESPLENPEENNTFKRKKLINYVRKHRPQLLVDALTILRAFCVAGKPDQGLTAWGSFEGWSDLVRQCVVWCGMEDPAGGRRQLRRRGDVTTENLGVLMTGWRRLDPENKGLTCSQVITRLFGCAAMPVSLDEEEAEMRTAVEALLKRPTTQALGSMLRSQARKVVNGYFFAPLDQEHGSNRWVVLPASEFSTGREE
jgi:hypothetical protein